MLHNYCAHGTISKALLFEFRLPSEWLKRFVHFNKKYNLVLKSVDFLLKMSQKLTNNLRAILFVIILILPRQFGLLAARSDLKTQQLYHSFYWRIYSILCILVFAITYPIAIWSILSIKDVTPENKVHLVIEIINHIAMYLFSMLIYIRALFTIALHMDYSNSSFKILNECKALCADNRETAHIFPLAIRVIFSFAGYVVLNAIALMENGENLQKTPIFYVFIYFIPDYVAASTLVRVATSISMQVISCERIGQAFSECMSTVRKSFKKSTLQRLRIDAQANQRFDRITECHSNVYELTRRIEKLTSNLVICSIMKIFIHIATMVIKYALN